MASATNETSSLDTDLQRIRLEERHLQKFKAEKIAEKWRQQDKYIDFLEDKLDQLKDQSKSKLDSQNQDSTRRENILIMRLASKEQEAQDMINQIQELKCSLAPSTSNLRTTLLDPCVNLLFQKMQSQIKELQGKLAKAEEELNAWSFTADSVTGKKLMGKCRMLIDENEELGRQLSQGRVAQLQAELSLQKSANEEMQKNLDEMTGFVLQLDEEVEGMQATILHLQQQLKYTQDKLKTANEKLEKNYEDKRRDEAESSSKIKSEKYDDDEKQDKRKRSEDEEEVVKKKKDKVRSKSGKESKRNKHKDKSQNDEN
ncbi:pre-mRNA-splicing regulator WTAP-like isoform X1 [Bolinopsis microptera]|uniref:pre-mRNA-splicing regulator WTAP-like isoform X1 n=1 Tax=Bolinopsis microptera TaxID=2820187 RepID=UPI003078F8B9